MSVTPPRSSVETDEDALRVTKIVREGFVKQDFPVSDDRVGRFLFDTSLQTVKLYVLDSYEDYTSECAYLLLTAIDWTYFYNQIWREFNLAIKSGTFSSGMLLRRGWGIGWQRGRPTCALHPVGTKRIMTIIISWWEINVGRNLKKLFVSKQRRVRWWIRRWIRLWRDRLRVWSWLSYSWGQPFRVLQN